MSVRTQIDRIISAKNAILTAIANKGVSVPLFEFPYSNESTSANVTEVSSVSDVYDVSIDEIASLVDAIPSPDFSNVTVTPETLKQGVIAYDKTGNLIVGTAQM